MLVFVDADLFSGGESFREGPTIDYEADALKNGNVRVIWAPESRGKRIGVANWRGRGSHHRDIWRRRRYNDIRGGGKIASRGEQGMGGRVV